MAPRTDGGQVDVRFSIANAEVVRQALQSLGKDGEKALKQFDAAAQPVARSTGLVSQAMAGLRSQAEGLAGGLGAAGLGFASIHPAALVATAAVGGLILLFGHMREEANRLSNDAGRLVDFGQTVQLTVEQIQALRFAGGQAGVSFERIEASVGKLTVSMQQLRNGTGEAFEQVRKIDAELARQLATTRSTAEAIDLVARAWERADTVQRNALSRAFFGRGGLDFGRVLAQINDAGGLENFTRQQERNVVLTTQQAERFDQLRDRIDATKARARDLMASLWTEQVLERQLKAAEREERIARAIVESLKAERERKRVQSEGRPLGPQVGDPGSNRKPPSQRQLIPLDEFGAVPPPPPTPPEPTAQFRLNEFRQYVQLLGAAATPAEQLRLKQLEFAASLESVNRESSDFVRLQGAAARGLAAFVDAQNAAMVAARQRLGILTEDELLRRRMLDLDKAERDGYIRSAQERVQAEQLIRKEIKDTMDQLEVRASRFPTLTRFTQEASDLDKQMDQLAVGGMNNFSTALTDIAMGTKNAKDAFKDLALQVTRSVIEMVIRMQIALPIARALQAAMTSFLPGGGNILSQGSPGLGGAPFDSYMGNIFSGGRVIPFAQGGVVSRPGFFNIGSIAEFGPEAIMPLRRTPGGRLGVESSSQPIIIKPTVTNNASDKVSADVSASRGRDGSLDIEVTIEQIVAKKMAGGSFDKSLQRVGGRPVVTRR